MTWLLGTALIVALGVIATLTGATLWLARRALQRSDQRGDLREKVAGVDAAIKRWTQANFELGDDLDNARDELGREVAARKVVEAQRDKAIQNLAKHGDPDAVAAAINSDLERLQALSGRLREVRNGAATGTATGTADGGDGDRAVHGAIESGDRPDGG